jgi:hypothetical protein
MIPSSFLILLWRQPAGEQHLLHQVVLHAPDRLILRNCEVVHHGIVANVGGEAVPVDVDSPLKSVEIGVPSAHVLCLQQKSLVNNNKDSDYHTLAE